MRIQRFGIEIEMTGITREQAAAVIAGHFGTESYYIGTYSYSVGIYSIARKSQLIPEAGCGQSPRT